MRVRRTPANSATPVTRCGNGAQRGRGPARLCDRCEGPTPRGVLSPPGAPRLGGEAPPPGAR
eukprot:3667424-Prymnesium_polylepis.1